MVEEIRQAGDTDDRRKKLEEGFSEFYNSKKDMSLSVPFDEAFVLQELRFNPNEPEADSRLEAVPKIVLLKPVLS